MKKWVSPVEAAAIDNGFRPLRGLMWRAALRMDERVKSKKVLLIINMRFD